MNDFIQTFGVYLHTIAVYALPVLFAITLHEAAHAYAAKFFGDTTAYSQGRMSMDPFKHIDPFGTILIPVILYVATSGAFLFGYAKPVPVNFGQLRRPKRDMAWVALAGPGANFLMALIWLLLAIALQVMNVQEPFFHLMAQAGISTNLVIFAFNLFPIPPLDGGRIMISVLPHKYAYKLARIEPYGFFIVMALVMLRIINDWWMRPLMLVTGKVLQLIIWPLLALLQ
ncbi:site-2 protease family protein [Oxalobacteraceae bacterium CAVE-383]|nr:site-2 protease family protein [Oxalobacteraceae bacterium CAVE-383]